MHWTWQATGWDVDPERTDSHVVALVDSCVSSLCALEPRVLHRSACPLTSAAAPEEDH